MKPQTKNCLSKRKVVISIIIFALYSWTLITFSMWSATRQDSFFNIVRSVKQFFLPPLSSHFQEEYRLNKFKQLIYHFEKKVTPAPTTTERTLVAFVFGQSNAANHSGERYISNGNVYNYFDGKFYKAVDPLLGSTGTKGGPWTLLGNKLVERGLADKVILIPAAIESTSVSMWSPGGEFHPILESRLKDAQKRGLKITHFLWHQGEQDNLINVEIYKTELKKIIDLTQKYFPDSKFFVAQTSRCGPMPSVPLLLDAQKAMAHFPHVFEGPRTDNIIERFDGCHFSGLGLEQYSSGWADAIQKANLAGTEDSAKK